MIHLSEACHEKTQFLHFTNTSFRTGPATTGSLEHSFLEEAEGTSATQTYSELSFQLVKLFSTGLSECEAQKQYFSCIFQ